MTYLYLALIVSAVCLADVPKVPQKKDLVFVDGIKAVFRGSQGPDLVFSSELERSKLDGTPTTLPEIISDLALAQEAKKYHLWPTPDEVDKQLRALGDVNKKTVKEFEDLLITIGYTPQEGRNAFAQISATNSLIGFKITANLIVPEADVIAYHNDHPQIEPAAYYISYALIPLVPDKTLAEQNDELVKLLSSDSKQSIQWQSPFWIMHDALAADKQFITQLTPGQIASPLQTERGFELFKLIEKRAERRKTLDECYNAIVTLLRKPKYTELLTNFQKNLLDSASITYFDIPN